MAKFSVNANRFDPYKNFKFRVKWDGRYVAGVSKVSALKRTTTGRAPRRGDPSTVRKSPGQTKFDPITLERGVTHDIEFEAWANKVWNFGSGLGAEVSLKDFRKDIIIEVYNEAGQLVLAYKVYRCWVSEFTALPELDASANAVAIQSIVLQHEGWERDYDVTEPSEPSLQNRRSAQSGDGKPEDGKNDRKETRRGPMQPLSFAELLTVWEENWRRPPLWQGLALDLVQPRFGNVQPA